MCIRDGKKRKQHSTDQLPSCKQEGLMRAAQLGNIDALYAFIQDDPNVLRRIDQIEFIDTPLHIAAAAGHADFAMEMMNLRPSFARKLNQRGLSPIHLALQNNNDEVVTDLLSIDRDLVRVKGREGYTALHIVARDGKVPLLSQFLEQCPDCIFDLTIRKESALHIAARNNQLEAVEAFVQHIKKGIFLDLHNQLQKKGILNLQDNDGNTILHIAAMNNQLQMIKILNKCEEIDMNKVNGNMLTALNVLKDLQTRQMVDTKESIEIMGSAKYLPLRYFEESRFHKKVIRDVEAMKPETINALLVVFALFLTMTCQAVLSPPGSVFQGDINQQNVGKSVMNRHGFLQFYIANGLAFSMSMFITLFLASVVAKSIMPFLLLLSILMYCCYGAAMSTLSPQ